MKFVVQTPGDYSVGIQGDRAELEYDLSHLERLDQKIVAEQIRTGLFNLFEAIMDGKLSVSIPCPTCGGEGEIYAGPDTTGGDTYNKCPDCNGKGEAI